MENDKKALWQRYSELTTADLIELQRSTRLPTAEAAMVDEMLELRGVSKTARENLRNSSVISSVTPAEATLKESDIVYKDVAARPLLVALIALFALWGFISNMLSTFDAKSSLSFLYFLALAILSIFLAYGLWGLKRWARSFMIFYCGLHIFLSWFLILLLFMSADNNWNLPIEELAHSVAVHKLSVNSLLKAAIYKGLFVGASIRSVIYGLLMAYFFKPDVSRLFQ